MDLDEDSRIELPLAYSRQSDYSEDEGRHSLRVSRRASTLGAAPRRATELLQSIVEPSYAVRFIHRESQEWHSVVRPFVSDLAFRSLTTLRFQSDLHFHRYSCHAAVLFVDLSGYSKITAAIAHRGAHAISDCVNSYLKEILDVVKEHGGDVVKFAGDAIIVVWDGDESEIGINVLCAAKCVVELLSKCSVHPVPGTDLSFGIHCGLTYGPLDSEVFEGPKSVHMQRLFHSVGGKSFIMLNWFVELAKSGEVCICYGSAAILRDKAHVGQMESADKAVYLFDLSLDSSDLERIRNHVDLLAERRGQCRLGSVEEDFIHPSVLDLLSHGGKSPTQIAQMRNLCVLFIAMTSHGSWINWLLEVRQCLDRHRCSIVQIIDDDKGVHVVAAVNLYESVPDFTALGLAVCSELVDVQVGCAVGMARGSTFCGVTGSSSVACRWDITGPPAVRAARLMQYALKNGFEVVIDQSVYDDPLVGTQLKVLADGVSLKGSPSPLTVYTLSGVSVVAAFRVLDTVYANVHNAEVKRVLGFISSARNRCAVVVTGIPYAGKKIVCQRAAGKAGLVPFLHVSDHSAGLLQLARTIAMWFQYSPDQQVQLLAKELIVNLEHERWCRSHDECVRLVDLAIDKGLRSCFLVDRIQFLDDFSMSLLRQCLSPQARTRNGHAEMDNKSRPRLENEGETCFLCVHGPLYNGKKVLEIVQDMTRSRRDYKIPVVEIGEATREELRTVFRDLSDMEVEDRWLDAYAGASGYCVGYFVARAAAIRNISGKLWGEGKRSYAETTEELVLHIPRGLLRINRLLPVSQISPDIAMRFSQIYDDLPPVHQTVVKILSLVTHKGFCSMLEQMMYEVLNDLLAFGVERDVFETVLEELIEMRLVRMRCEGEEERCILFCNPALGDIARDMSTPAQFSALARAVIDRAKPHLKSSFRIAFLLADLNHLLGSSEDLVKQLWVQGYRLLEKECTTMEWPRYKIDWWKEVVEDEISAQGYDAYKLLGEPMRLDYDKKPVVGKRLPLVKVYSAPIAFGPMGHTLSLICRNIFHEFGVFHGTSESRSQELWSSSRSAFGWYVQETTLIEGYLEEHGLKAAHDMIEAERWMVKYLTTPARSARGVQEKAAFVLDQLVPRFVSHRLERLRQLVSVLRKGDIPDVVMEAEPALRTAYIALRGSKHRSLAAQDALMILASFDWKPEPLPHHYSTVARVRNLVLKKLTESELILFHHQQTIDDLEAFLLVTCLIYQSQEVRFC